MRWRVGTSGFSYKEWKGTFYPEDLPDKKMLPYYAERLDAVEINNTFYRMPTAKLLEGWAAQVPENFAFALKAPRRITHQKKLREVEEDVAYLLQTAGVLGPRLGPFLIQLPPYLKKDVPLLADFVRLIPPGTRAGIEFRSSSWEDDAVHETLKGAGVALVVSDMDDKPEPRVVATAPFGYARLRRVTYDDAAMEAWARRFADAGWDETFVFFKHEEAGAGPRYAARFRELAAA